MIQNFVQSEVFQLGAFIILVTHLALFLVYSLLL